MATKFKKINKIQLRNDAHFQFHTEFKTLYMAKLFEDTAPASLKLLDKYLSSYADEDTALKKIRKSHLTEQIQAADKVRDDVFSGMAEQNSALLKHYDTAKREAANRLQIVFNTYGNVARKSLNEETSAIYNLLQDLRSPKYQADTTAVGLTEWATELETRNKALEALVRERDSETDSKTDIVLKEARNALDDVYNELTERAEAFALVGTNPAPYVALIEAFNVVVDRFNRLLNGSGKRGKGEGGGGETEEGEEQ
ncbi:MAG: DUF6261 family protein [Fibromonadales bacterium]|nr:DUF6261 family protein [Fibromonadales bacterium]